MGLVSGGRRRYTPAMRKIIVATLLFLGILRASGDSIPTNWKIIKDSKSVCQIAVPENWTAGADNTGSAYLQDPTVAIAVVTSQPTQAFKPISDSMLHLLNVTKESLFENSAKRVFYQDRPNASAPDSHSLNIMVPGRTGTCSARVVYPPTVPEDTARKIALTLAPVPEAGGATQ